MSNTLTVELVSNDGHIDWEASQEAFRTALLKRVADQETETVQIAEAVATLFDRHFGKAIPMPTLGSMVAQALQAEPENFKVLSDRALNYIRANAQGDVKDGVAERPDSTFVIGKGKNGGCYRRADRPVKGAQGQTVGQATEAAEAEESEEA